MIRSWTALAVLTAIFAVAGCNDYGNTFQNNTGASLSFLSPAGVNAGGGDFTLLVNGGGFVAKTVVQWNGKTIPTTVSLDSNGNVISVTATVSASLIQTSGKAYVNTLNPHSGSQDNGLSNTLAFQIYPPPNPVPTLSGISPASAAAGSSSVSMTVTGTNFISTSDPTTSSQVVWTSGTSQTSLTTGTDVTMVGKITAISATQISVTIGPNLLTTAGTATVGVYNPPVAGSPSGGGGPSVTTQTFTITTGTGAVKAKAQAASEETPAVSADGRYVAYTAVQDANTQIFLRDTCQGAASGCKAQTAVISAAEDGTAGNDDSHYPSMSSDGRFVAFSSAATNLASSAPKGRQIYLRDTCAGATGSCAPSTQLISTDESGALLGTESILPSVSSSGRFIAFLAVTPSASGTQAKGTAASNAGGASASSVMRQVFVRDTCLAATNCTPRTTRISLQPGTTDPAATVKPAGPALSGDAKNVALADDKTATLFTHVVAVDDRVFLAVTGNQK